MKNVKLFILILFVGLFIGGNGCRKDDTSLLQNNAQNIHGQLFHKKSNWDEAESKFFDIKNHPIYKKNTISPRTGSDKFIFHPSVIELFNTLVSINDTSNLVSNVIQSVGYPLWRETTTIKSSNDGPMLLVLPFTKDNQKTSGLLLAEKVGDSYKFSGMSRELLYIKLQSERKQNYISYLNKFTRTDKKVFNFVDPVFKDVKCAIDSEGLEFAVSGDDDCEWVEIEVCTSTKGAFWITGWSIYPPHLDHDMDGIPNGLDQDWYDFTARYNVTQEEFERRIRDYFDERDMDYDDYFDANDYYNNYYEGGGSDFDFDWLIDFYYDFIDWLGDILDDIGDFSGELWDDIWGDGIPCPWEDNPIKNEPKVTSRTVDCKKWLVEYCGEINEWQDWEDIFNRNIIEINYTYTNCSNSSEENFHRSINHLQWLMMTIGQEYAYETYDFAKDLLLCELGCDLTKIKSGEELEKIYEFYTSTLIEPCVGYNSNPNDLLLYSLCYNGNLTMDAINKVLERVDHITIIQSHFNGCPQIKCLINNLKEGNISDHLSNQICSLFQPQDNPKGLIFTAGPNSFNNEPNATAGAVVNISSTGKKTHNIIFNTNNCNNTNDALKNFATIQHELIHVEIHEKLISQYGWNGDEATKQDAFNAMISSEYPGKNYQTSHELMLSEYLDEMLNGLMQANGGLGLPPPNSTDIYLGIVLDAFAHELPYIQEKLGFNKSDIEKFLQNYNTWIASNNGSNKSSSGVFGLCP